MVRLALALITVSAWLVATPVGISSAQEQADVDVTIGKGGFDEVESAVVKVGASLNDAASAMCVSEAAGGGYSSMPGGGAVTIIGLRSVAAMDGSLPLSGEGAVDGNATSRVLNP
jgi:hypothetical protein